MGSAPSGMSFGEVFRRPDFRRLWLAQAVSIFGDFLALFAVLSAVSFRMHATPEQVTGISIAFMLPLALMGPPAGVMVDRMYPKATMIASDLIRAVLVLLLVFSTSLWQVYAVLLAQSCVSSFFMPAQSVTLRSIVPKEGLMAANGLMQQVFYIIRILAPSAAGALVAWLGESSCYLLDSASFVFSALMIGGIAVARPAERPATSYSGLWHDFTSGLRFIFTHPAVSFVITAMTAGLFVMGAFSPLIAVYVRDDLKAGSVIFGVVSSMIGVGMIAGTQGMSRLLRNASKNHMVLYGLAGVGAAIALMGAMPHAAAAVGGALAMGVSVALIIVPAQTLIQHETPPAMMGRVSSSMMSAIAVAQVLGLLLSGNAAHALGIRNLFLACAVLLAVIAAVGFRYLRAK